jgi:hypothetical protein
MRADEHGNEEKKVIKRNGREKEKKKRRMWETCGGLGGWRNIHYHHHLLKLIIIHFRQHMNMNFLICSLTSLSLPLIYLFFFIIFSLFHVKEVPPFNNRVISKVTKTS